MPQEAPPDETGSDAALPRDPAECLDEVARILALGILRLKAGKAAESSQFRDLAENPLDFGGDPSVSGAEHPSRGEAR